MRTTLRGGLWLALGLATGLCPACSDPPVAGADGSGSGASGTGRTEDGGATTTGPGAVDSTAAAPTTSDGDSGSDSDSTGEPTWDGLLAGVAVRYLDRPIGVSMAGYGGRLGGTNTPWSGTFFGSRGFYSLPTIKVIAIESAEGERLILLKTPLMSGESGVTDAVVAALQERHGLDLAGRIIVTATHSHHVHGRYWRLPDIFGAVGADTADEEVIALLGSEFADTVAEAIDDLGPAQWAYTSVEDWDPDDLVYRDRRSVNDFAYGKDPRLMMLAVRRPEGEPLATVINFAMHGTLLGADNELLTEDAAGGLEMVFEEEFFAANGQPVVGMFMQAGGGDAAPAGGSLGHDGIARAEVLGRFAAPTLLEQWDAMPWRDDATVDVHTRRVDLTWEYFGYDQDDEFYGAPLGIPVPLPYTWGGWQCTSSAAPDDNDPSTSMEGELKECIPLDVLLLGDVPHPEVHQTLLTTARIDELFLSTAPGEPTHSVMHYLRQQVQQLASEEQPAEVMGIGYSQDHLLYLTHPDDWFQGGYEAEMSLWGPYAGRRMMDEHVSIIEQMRSGQDMPPLVEQSPSGASPEAFTPRAIEESLNAGAVVQDVVMDAMRTQTVHFRFGAGDPSLGSPRVVVQVDQGDGTYEDVPSPAGWDGAAYDNSRYHMLTHYDPVPAPNGSVAAARQHEWTIDWEVPVDFPAGMYRLVARGPYSAGGVAAQFEAVSSPFAILAAEGSRLDLSQHGDTLHLALTVPATPIGDPVPRPHWRAHDATRPADRRAQVRAPLRVQLGDQSVTAKFDPAKGVHTIDLHRLGVADPSRLAIEAHLASDRDPDPIAGTWR